MQNRARLLTEKTVAEIKDLFTTPTQSSLDTSLIAKIVEEMILAFCIGFLTCPNREELAGFIYSLKELIQLGALKALAVPKSQVVEKAWMAEMGDLLEQIPLVHIDAWRESQQWRDASAAYNAFFFSKSWEEYRNYFIKQGTWEIHILPHYLAHLKSKDEITEDDSVVDLKQMYEKIKQELNDAIERDANTYAEHHVNDGEEMQEGESDKDRIARLKKTSVKYLKAEVRDLLAMMRKLVDHSPQLPKYKTLMLYKTEGNEMSKALKENAWAFGYEASTIKVQKISYRKMVGVIENGVYKKKSNDALPPVASVSLDTMPSSHVQPLVSLGSSDVYKAALKLFLDSKAGVELAKQAVLGKMSQKEVDDNMENFVRAIAKILLSKEEIVNVSSAERSTTTESFDCKAKKEISLQETQGFFANSKKLSALSMIEEITNEEDEALRIFRMVE